MSFLNAELFGLPNVGKSTLLMHLVTGGAESANFPFCTIDPNVWTRFLPNLMNRL